MPYKDPSAQRASAQRHYARNRRVIIDRATAHKRAMRARIGEYLRALKTGTPCMDCGGSFAWYVMQFDHVRGEKLFDLGSFRGSGWTMRRVTEEVEKCDIVCANCHAERTYNRAQLGGRDLKHGADDAPRDENGVNLSMGRLHVIAHESCREPT